VLDAVGQARGAWVPSPVSRRMAVGLQLAAAPLGLGVVAALAYFGLVRPALVSGGASAATAGLEMTTAEPAGSNLHR